MKLVFIFHMLSVSLNLLRFVKILYLRFFIFLQIRFVENLFFAFATLECDTLGKFV